MNQTSATLIMTGLAFCGSNPCMTDPSASILERLSAPTFFSLTTHPALASSHPHHRSRDTDFDTSKMDVLRAAYSSSCLRCTSKDGRSPHRQVLHRRPRHDRVPAARLSPELLSYIFFWCLTTHTFRIYD
jgi:hypothetical protein